MWLHRPSGGRRALEERARAAEARSHELQAVLEELGALPALDGGGGDIPAELLAAASMAGPDGQAVKTCIDGQEVIVVVGDEGGSPAQWRAAISRGLREHGIAS